MITIRFKNATKHCPENWGEVLFGKFAGFEDIKDADVFTHIAYFLEVSVDVVKKLDAESYGKVMTALQFTNKEIKYKKPILYTKDIGLDEVGKFELLKELLDKPFVEQVYGSLKIYLGKEEHEVNDMTVEDVKNLHTFFLKSAKEFQNGMIKGALKYRLTKTVRQPGLAILQGIGNSYTHLTIYLKAILSKKKQ